MQAREAIAAFVDGNADRLQEWLDQIATQDGPKAAFQCFTDLLEFHVPKLTRSEINAKHTLRSLDQELSDLNEAHPDATGGSEVA
jgi:gamma-glutamyl:cysteine ligase YbdK (ATP-grasp superfamily)